VLSGIFLWWPRGGKGGVVTIRATPKYRMFWRDLHAVLAARRRQPPRRAGRPGGHGDRRVDLSLVGLSMVTGLMFERVYELNRRAFERRTRVLQ
jgi:uncharacterized iron-regulated membrane protein